MWAVTQMTIPTSALEDQESYYEDLRREEEPIVPPLVDRIWDTWGYHYHIDKFHILST